MMKYFSLISLALTTQFLASPTVAQTELTVQYAYPSHQAFER